MQYLRQNLLIAGLFCIVIGGAVAAVASVLLPFGITVGLLGIGLFLWGFSAKLDESEWTQGEIDAWRPKATTLDEAGRVMYRVDTTLYEPKMTTVLCGSCSHISEVEGGRPNSFECEKCGILLWEKLEEE
ncbi:MAG TPA: hypothetical protein EYN46_01575 [Candidatus Poseidoniales archaeon]|nr:hypothetical protein [Candidatus Poseidoniales archaeon]HIO94036.1 hypothetical protein [Candidatus Poseidoniales archaeon]